jgi:hypothetical protein
VADGEQQGGPPAEDHRTASYVGVGCFTAFVGFWGGGMIAVLVAKIVGFVTKCPGGSRGEPCSWWIYARVGMILGAVLLPTIALWKLRRGSAGGAGGAGQAG